MQPVALIPVPFSSVSRLIATASRFCSRQSSVLRPPMAHRSVRAGDVIRLALLAPELRFPIDVNCTVVARSFQPTSMVVRYELADLSQIEAALGQLYSRTRPMLPVALDVATYRDRPVRLSALSPDGAVFDVAGELSTDHCGPDAEIRLQLPHQNGRLELGGRVCWITPRPKRSRMHVSFKGLADLSRKMLDDIVFRFRLGAAPWTPKLVAPGL